MQSNGRAIDARRRVRHEHGLRYIPGFYSNTDEVVALSKVAADSGGIYTSHLREEGLGLFEGVARRSRSAGARTSRSCSRITRRSAG